MHPVIELSVKISVYLDFNRIMSVIQLIIDMYTSITIIIILSLRHINTSKIYILYDLQILIENFDS